MSSPVNLAAALLIQAQQTLDSGTGVETSPNNGSHVRQLAARFKLVPPLNWCALQVSEWLAGAYAMLGIPPVIPGSPVAQAIMGQLIGAHLWVPKMQMQLEHLIPGNIIVWKRPPGPWQGHIGVIKEWIPNNGYDGVTFKAPNLFAYTIEGNSGPKGDRVALMKRSYWDQNLLGISKLHTITAKAFGVEVEPICEKDPLS